MAIFGELEQKNFIICMETQKTPNSQNNLDSEVSQKGFVILIVTDCSSEWQNKKWNRKYWLEAEQRTVMVF